MPTNLNLSTKPVVYTFVVYVGCGTPMIESKQKGSRRELCFICCVPCKQESQLSSLKLVIVLMLWLTHAMAILVERSLASQTGYTHAMTILVERSIASQTGYAHAMAILVELSLASQTGYTPAMTILVERSIASQTCYAHAMAILV